jgi:hypothetical protein
MAQMNKMVMIFLDNTSVTRLPHWLMQWPHLRPTTFFDEGLKGTFRFTLMIHKYRNREVITPFPQDVEVTPQLFDFLKAQGFDPTVFRVDEVREEL